MKNENYLKLEKIFNELLFYKNFYENLFIKNTLIKENKIILEFYYNENIKKDLNNYKNDLIKNNDLILFLRLNNIKNFIDLNFNKNEMIINY